MSDKNLFAIIEDTVTFNELLESEDISINSNDQKAKFRAIIQTADEKNGRNRIYPKDLLMKGIQRLTHRIESRTLLGEMDHPLPTYTTREANILRESVVLYKESSHLFNNIWLEGNKVIADVETLSNTHGRDLANMILKDRLPIGFSLRAFGNLVRRSDGTSIVTEPFAIVTWDAVTNPSHATARLTEIKESDVLNVLKKKDLLENVDPYVLETLIESKDIISVMEDEDLLELITKHVNVFLHL